MPATTLKTASVLAFERKLDPSDGLFASGSWDDRDNAGNWPAIGIRAKSVRGTISNRLKAKEQDPAKLDAQIDKPNLQTVDVATLPHDADTLMLRFTLRVLGGAGQPSACNDADYEGQLGKVVHGYVEQQGFSELSRRYATNLANGRFLWRNRVGAESAEVRVALVENGNHASSWRFDALDFSLRNFEVPSQAGSDLAALADAVEKGLTGAGHVLLEITAFARVGNGQEVFPSQELIMDRGTGDKSKTLYDVGGVAGMHSQKIGNALRTIDTWYPREDEDLGPIAAEPYGSVTTKGKAYRQPKQKNDFYSLLDNWILRDKVPAPDQQHFVMAILVRGGVFGEGAS